jgi:hypothetical protein
MASFIIPQGSGPLPAPMPGGNLPAEIDVTTEIDDGRSTKLTWSAGESKRLAAVCFKEGPDGKLILRLRSQKEFSKFGSVPTIWFREPENRALASQCALYFGDAKVKVGSIFLEYESDQNGNILAGAGYKLKPWIFSPDRYVQIQNIARSGWDLHLYDLLVACGRGQDDQKWQHLSITPCPESLLRKASPEFQEQVRIEAETLFNGALVKKFARYLPDEEIMKLLGSATVAGAVPVQPDNPFLGGGAASPDSPFAPPTKEPGPASAPTHAAFSDLVANETQKPAPDKKTKS